MPRESEKKPLFGTFSLYASTRLNRPWRIQISRVRVASYLLCFIRSLTFSSASLIRLKMTEDRKVNSFFFNQFLH